MGQIGYRRKGDQTPLYNPERDYAYITPTLMRMAIELLDAKEPQDRVKFRLDHGITQGVVAKIAESLALAQSDFVNAADPVKNLEAALDRHGFFNFNYITRQYLFAAIGEVFCAAWFTAVREVSSVEQESPAAVDMARFTAAVRAFAVGNDVPTYDINYVAEYRAMQTKTLKAQLAYAIAEADKYKSECYRLTAALHAASAQPAVKPSFFARVVALFRKKKNA